MGNVALKIQIRQTGFEKLGLVQRILKVLPRTASGYCSLYATSSPVCEQIPSGLTFPRFMLRERVAGQSKNLALSANGQTVYFYSHCCERVTGDTSAMVLFLNGMFILNTEIISTGCCGMRGGFGYLHSNLSKKFSAHCAPASQKRHF